MEKQRWEESEKRRAEEKIKEEKESEERRCRCAKRKEGRATLCFPMICGSGKSKRRLAKAVGAEPSGQMRDEKVHAIVARSTFGSQNVQNTSASEHFLEVVMSKECTPLWREAHFHVKI